MTTSGPAFVSEDELVRQLQSVLRAVKAASGAPPPSDKIQEARALAEELSMRVYNEPKRWGIAGIPAEFRDDVAADTYAELLFAIDSMRPGRQSILEWFAVAAETKFNRVLSLAERQRAEQERRDVAAAANPRPAGEPEEAAAPTAFSLPNDGWARFEAEFPRDAFALRLRYLLKQTPEEMVAMLDAPSTRAITMRLDRARDRFKMFCEQQGMSRRDVGQMLSQFSEVSSL